MAEGIARARAPRGVRVWSAGSSPSRVNPLAVAALSEIGIDISRAASKGLDAVPLGEIDIVVTLCAEEVCPVFPRPVERIHWPLHDPAAVAGTDEERLEAFRAAREELRARVAELFRTRVEGDVNER